MTQQIALRIPDSLADALQALVEQGRYPTRAAAIRAGVEAVVERERERRIDEAIVAGYRRYPPTAAEERWVEASTAELLAEEQW